MHHFGTPGCCWRDPGTSRIGVGGNDRKNKIKQVRILKSNAMKLTLMN